VSLFVLDSFGVAGISFSVRKTIRRVVYQTSQLAQVALAPDKSVIAPQEESRQLALNIEQKPIGKPTAAAVDLLIQSTFDAYEPGLSLPPVRVSGRMRRTLGSYMPSRKQIAISSRLLAMGDENDVRQVVLHEIAHAIVHARWGDKPSAHGSEFRAVCKEIGVKPRRYVDVTTEKWQSQTRFLSKCGHCKMLIVRKKRMRSVRCVCGLKLYPKSWRAVAPTDGGAAGDWVML
jgi:predicted SprT family Zn-dependent metalloprotease